MIDFDFEFKLDEALEAPDGSVDNVLPDEDTWGLPKLPGSEKGVVAKLISSGKSSAHQHIDQVWDINGVEFNAKCDGDGDAQGVFEVDREYAVARFNVSDDYRLYIPADDGEYVINTTDVIKLIFTIRNQIGHRYIKVGSIYKWNIPNLVQAFWDTGVL